VIDKGAIEESTFQKKGPPLKGPFSRNKILCSRENVHVFSMPMIRRFFMLRLFFPQRDVENQTRKLSLLGIDQTRAPVESGTFLTLVIFSQ